MSAYDFTVKTMDGQDKALADYRGSVLLIVNTATGCGFTPQYSELQELYEQYHDRGFEILDFPCNQFGEQAPGSNAEIHSFCTGRFGITFPQFAKVDVKGEGAAPLFKWLEENTVFKGFDKNPMGLMLGQVLAKTDRNYKENNSIKWNFTKFLIDRDGTVVARFEPMTAIKKLKSKLEEII